MSAETPDQAATRRRWITLAEVVAVAGVVIAGLTLWTGWSDRRADRAEKVAEQKQEAQAKRRFQLATTVTAGAIAFRGGDSHEIKDLAVRFPGPLHVTEQRPADFTLSRDAFEAALLKATDGGPDAQAGRLPVLVTITYWDGDGSPSVRDLYDIVWRTDGRLLRGRSLTLEAMRLRQRGASPAQLDAAWAAERRRQS